MLVILLFSAIFPVAIFLFFIYKKDTKKEPPKLLAKSFMWGCIAALPVIIVELILDYFNIFNSAFLQSFYNAFIVAAFVEEGFKFLCLYLIIWKHKEFDQYYDGIVYAVFVSLGFAVVENIVYVIQFGIVTSILRAILPVPGHGLFGVIMGYFFALAKFSTNNKRKKLLWLSFLLPFFIHGLYDFFLFYMQHFQDNVFIALLFIVFFIILMVFLWRYGIRYIKKHYAKDKEEILINKMTE